jgi:hypothetical protein
MITIGEKTVPILAIYNDGNTTDQELEAINKELEDYGYYCQKSNNFLIFDDNSGYGYFLVEDKWALIGKNFIRLVTDQE